jgi:hypothetical protein
MIRDRFCAVKAEATPSFALGGLEALEEVKKRDRGGAVFFYGVRDRGEDCSSARLVILSEKYLQFGRKYQSMESNLPSANL